MDAEYPRRPHPSLRGTPPEGQEFPFGLFPQRRFAPQQVRVVLGEAVGRAAAIRTVHDCRLSLRHSAALLRSPRKCPTPRGAEQSSCERLP